MKKINRVFFAMLILALVVACGTSTGSTNPSTANEEPVVDCRNADLTVVSGSNARLFLDDRSGTEGLVSQFEKESGYKVCIQPMSGPKAVDWKNSLLLFYASILNMLYAFM